MRFGIIAEGSTDQAVIINILKGLGIDSSDVIPLRPDLQVDETDRVFQFRGGTWQGVKNDCLEKTELESFFEVADNNFIVIQLDTAEDFGITKPQKTGNPKYASQLRTQVIELINKWLSGDFAEKLLYAITIEEMEAWILTIYLNQETTTFADPKQRLRNELDRKNITRKGCRNDSDFYDKISKDFRKNKNLEKYSLNNLSLLSFVNSVEIILNKL